jgi:microcystin-dependent protein
MKGRFPIGDNSTLTLLGIGGSATIGTNNLPAHSHPNTATAATSVSLTDPGHSHTIDTFNPGTGGSTIGAPEPGYGADAGTEANVVNSNTTGITVASSTTTVTMTNANNVTTASDYYPPYLVVNYIIKHD